MCKSNTNLPKLHLIPGGNVTRTVKCQGSKYFCKPKYLCTVQCPIGTQLVLNKLYSVFVTLHRVAVHFQNCGSLWMGDPQATTKKCYLRYRAKDPCVGFNPCLLPHLVCAHK